MISFTKEHHILEDENPYNMWVHQQDDMMIYEKGNVVFAFNFHPNRSFEGYFVPVSKAGKYLVDRIVLRRTLSIIRLNFQMEEQASLLICQVVQQQHFAESRMQYQKKRLPQLRMR